MNITSGQLKQITGLHSTVDRLINYFIETLNFYEINTTLRICHFLAQVLEESGNLQYQEEIASGSAYEGRQDLGNIHPGDGIKYKGRGLIQITGLKNYELISRDLTVDFVNNPQLLAGDKYAVLSAGWYWHKNNLNAHADNDELVTITEDVNGGLNGEDIRLKWLKKCKSILNYKDFPDIQ